MALLRTFLTSLSLIILAACQPQLNNPFNSQGPDAAPWLNQLRLLKLPKHPPLQVPLNIPPTSEIHIES